MSRLEGELALEIERLRDNAIEKPDEDASGRARDWREGDEAAREAARNLSVFMKR